jgi:lysophospholipase L1-like esterase
MTAASEHRRGEEGWPGHPRTTPVRGLTLVLLALALAEILLASVLEVWWRIGSLRSWLASTAQDRARLDVVEQELLALALVLGSGAALLRRWSPGARAASGLLALSSVVFVTGTSESLASLVFAARYLALDPFHENRPVPAAWLPARAVRDARLGHRLIPNLSGEFWTNARGFRGPDLPSTRAENEIRIVAAGDSITWGDQLPLDEDTYPRILERRLGAESDSRTFHVLNAGVPSYASIQVRLLLEEHLQHWRPDLLIVCVGWNDLSYSYQPNWVPETPLAGAQIAHRQAFDPALGRLARWLRALLFPAPAPKIPASAPAAVDAYEQNLSAIVALARQNRVPLLLVNLPTVLSARSPADALGARRAWWTTRFDSVEDVARFQHALDRICQTGVPCFQDAFPSSESGKRRFFLDHCHFSAEGSAEMARRLHRFLASDPRFAWLRLKPAA